MNNTRTSHDSISVTPQCKVLIFPWKNEDIQQFGFEKGRYVFDNADLADSTVYDISSRVMRCSFSKGMNTASGTFSFTLTNSAGDAGTTGDWKDIIKPGSWCLIYMSQDGKLSLAPDVSIVSQGNGVDSREKPYVRCMGYIERVAINAGVGPNGELDMTYDISGRDFGVIYEETDIWHNMFQQDKIVLNNIKNSKLNITGRTSLDEVLDLVHDLVYYPRNIANLKGQLNKQDSLISIGLQWLLPKELLSAVNVKVTGDTYAGNVIKKNFEATSAGIAVSNPTQFLNGNAWQKLKTISVPQFHELFTETFDGAPELNFRPIPFAMNRRPYSKAGSFITEYKDLPAVEVPKVRVIGFDLGEEDHSRFNSFIAIPSSTLINKSDMINFLRGSNFPLHNFGSIKRHGFRPMHVTVDTLVKSAAAQDGASDRDLVVDYCGILVDYWNFSVYGESGNVNVIGLNEIKLGKCLTFESGTPYVQNNRYYIESYTDDFSVDDKGSAEWVQSIQLTRGFNEETLRTLSKTNPTDFAQSRRQLTFSERTKEFLKEGEFTPAKSTDKKGRKS